MLKPRLPLGAQCTARLTSSTLPFSISSLNTTLSALTISASKVQARHASHAAQGRANKAAPGPGKRLGAKKGDSEPVVPGNIIFRQRGSVWHPGENVVMGRDHTISATAKGYVRYYRDPERNPDKKYIGVVFEQNERLPRGRNSATKRRLGLDAVVMKHTISDGEILHEEVLLTETTKAEAKRIETEAPGRKPQLSLRTEYQYRQSNWSIGREGERRGVKVSPHNPNRWRKPMTKKLWKKTLRMERLSSKKGSKKNKK